MPVRALSPHGARGLEVLLLEPDGSLALFIAAERIGSVELTFSGSNVLAGNPSIQGLRDPVSNRCTACFGSGELYRLSLDLEPSSPSVEKCVAGIVGLIPRSFESMTPLTGTQRCEYAGAGELLVYLRRLYLPRMSEHAQSATNEVTEWDAFREACVTLVATAMGRSHESASNAPDDASLASDADWQSMLRSEPFSRLGSTLAFAAAAKPTIQPTPAAEDSSPVSGGKKSRKINHTLLPLARCLVGVLHLIYEDSKLDTRASVVVLQLGELLCQLTARLGWTAYVEHYQLDNPVLKFETGFVHEKKPAPGGEGALWKNADRCPLSLHDWLAAELGERHAEPYPVLLCRERASISEVVAGLYAVHHDSPGSGSVASVVSAQAVVLAFVNARYGLHELDCLAFDVALPIREAIQMCRADPPSHWPVRAYELIEREDLAALARGDSCPSERAQAQQDAGKPAASPAADEDGMFISGEVTSLRFGSDLRLREVRRMLSSSKAARVRLNRAPEKSDHDFASEQKALLLTLVQRKMSAPVGRGMYTLGTIRPTSDGFVTQAMVIPKMNLTGRAANKMAVLLDDAAKPPGSSAWPDFHNGVATGLKIARAGAAGDAQLSTTWIAYHRPPNNELTDEHAGFLMALGLTGHLTALSNMTIFDYLSKGHETTSAGILLGMAAAKRGTMDPGVAKMLSIHVPALLPSTSAEIEVAQIMQTAAIVGVGLLYQGTAHRRRCEELLTELGRRPGVGLDSTVDRESYSLGAGLALGMVTLGKGDSAPGLADLRIAERLRRYMEGGRETRKMPNVERSFHVEEGDNINIAVTSPGATIALGLMFLKRHNRAIAARLEVPDTQFLLDFIRPDFLLLRVLSRSLIMWDEIEPSKEWVEGNCPPVVAACSLGGMPAEVDGHPHVVDRETLSQAYANITAGACFAVGLRFAGSGDQEAMKCLMHFATLFLSAADDPLPLAGRPTLETCMNVVVVCIGMVRRDRN